MRACLGSFLPRTWFRTTPCPGGSAVARDVAAWISGAFPAGRSVPALAGGGQDPPRGRVTLVQRRGRSRRLANAGEVLQAIRALPEPPTALEEDMGNLSYAEQAAAWRRSDVVVAVHGAALGNLFLLPPGAGVVEITPVPPPWPFRNSWNIYANLAAWTGHAYRAVATADWTTGRAPAVRVDAARVAEAVAGILSADPARAQPRPRRLRGDAPCAAAAQDRGREPCAARPAGR